MLRVVFAVLAACAQRQPVDAVGGIFAAFERHPVVLIGEAHGLREAGDFYIRLVRDPRFARTVDDIVVEFASRHSQPVLDRYIAGGDVAPDELRRIWRDTTKVAAWESPIYAAWLAAIREVNAHSPRKIRVLAGDTSIDWRAIRDHAGWAALGDNNVSFAEVIAGVVARHRRALVVLGSNHVTKSGDRRGGPNTTTRVEARAPGATYVVLLAVPAFRDDAIAAAPGSLVPLGATPLARHGDALLDLGRELTEVNPPPGSLEPAYRDELERRAMIEWGEPRHRKLLGI